jgi:BirA family biotin operon repressor/biotin-[acetyl-CoA-carboxylase] ligase
LTDLERARDAPRFSIAHGFTHVHLEEVGSTNTTLIQLAGQGEDRLWLSATRQISGKGRSGRSWQSTPGNLFASVLLEDPAPADKAAGLSFACALALHDAMSARSGGAELSIKWPNDILINKRKVAGLLLEATQLGGGRLALVAGFGANCAHHPDVDEQVLFPPTSLRSEGFDVTAEALFAALHPAFANRLDQWDRGHGLSAILSDWKARAHGIGTEIRARTGTEELHGIFENIDETGRLVLRLRHGVRHISAADVFFH